MPDDKIEVTRAFLESILEFAKIGKEFCQALREKEESVWQSGLVSLD